MTEPAGAERRSADGHCVTCGDEATKVRVLELAEGTARCVDEGGVIHAVVVDLVGDVRPDEWLLAHAGVALTRLSQR
jgi:hydrogenase maturation factor